MPIQKYTFESELASVEVIEVAGGPIEFAGRTFAPDRGKAFVKAKLMHTLPTVNSNDRAVTAATMANSFQSAEFQLVDFEHQLRVFAPEKIFRDKIVGSIAGIQFPTREEAVALETASTPVPLEVLYVVWRNAEDVSDFLVDISSDKNSWKSSFEIARDTTTDALFFIDDGSFVPITEAAAGMVTCVEKYKVNAFEGREMALVLGGEDGNVVFTGAGLTRNPADMDATIEGVTASDRTWRLEAASISPPEDKHKMFVMGWQKEEAAGDTGKTTIQRKVAEREAAADTIGVVGQTSEDAGHKHDIYANMTTSVVNKHHHWVGDIYIDMAAKKVMGNTGVHYEVVEGEEEERHDHDIEISFAETSQTANQSHFTQEVVAMEANLAIKAAAVFEQLAASCEDKGQTKAYLDLANELKTDSASTSVDDALKDKVAAGDLITKTDHELKVKAASEAAVATYKASIKDAEDAKLARLETVKAAGLDPNMKIGANDKTIASVMGVFPLGDAGDQQLAAKIEDWKFLKANAPEETVVAGAVLPVIVPVGGGGGGSKPASLDGLI